MLGRWGDSRHMPPLPKSGPCKQETLSSGKAAAT
jgi:hypothetical protein